MKLLNLFILAITFCLPITGFTSVSTLVADTKSGLILASKNATAQQYPASLTKVMTLYMTFSAIDKGILKMDDRLPVSLKAARQPRSKLYVKPGQTISVKDAIMALIIISANDVAVVLAEALAPNETEFAKMMTQTAHSLGLKSTTFKNASGLHNPDQVTTAQDMAVLTMAMIHHFPHYYKLFSKKTFSYQGKVYRSHNHVQKRYKGAEGLKTGYISAVGYNIISTAKRNDSRLVSVVIGQDTVALRDRQAMRLLDKGFSSIERHKSKTPKDKNLLNKTAVLKQPDMMPHLKVMAERLDTVIKSQTPINRSKLLALNPFSIKVAQANEVELIPESKEAEKEEVIEIIPSLVEEGSNIEAEEKAEAEAEEEAQIKAEEKEKTKADEIVEFIDTPTKNEEEIKPVEQKITPVVPKKKDTEETVEVKTNPTGITEEIVEQGIVPAFIEEKTNTETQNKQTETIQTTEAPKQQTLTSLKPTQKAKAVQNASKWGVQVGAFGTQEKAQQQAQKAINLLKAKNKTIQTQQTGTYFRAKVSGFSSKKEAQKACKRLKSKKMDCLVFKN